VRLSWDLFPRDFGVTTHRLRQAGTVAVMAPELVADVEAGRMTLREADRRAAGLKPTAEDFVKRRQRAGLTALQKCAGQLLKFSPESIIGLTTPKDHQRWAVLARRIVEWWSLSLAALEGATPEGAPTPTAMAEADPVKHSPECHQAGHYATCSKARKPIAPARRTGRLPVAGVASGDPSQRGPGSRRLEPGSNTR
jgi:hypothetical protein